MSWEESLRLAQGEGNENDLVFAEGVITLWSNLLALMAMHLRDTGTPRAEVLEMLAMLQATNEETVRSPRARAIASRHLMTVYRVLADS